MLKGLSRFALRALPLLLLASPAWAATSATLVLSSDPGDAIAAGQGYTLSTPDATFIDFAFTNAHGVQLQINSATQGIWNLNFTAPSGQNLQVGTYDAPVLVAGGPRLQPTFSLSSPNNQTKSCAGGITARFTVLDMQRNNLNDLTSLAVDFDEFCSGAAAGLHGILRFNSSVPADAPRADAGPDQGVLQEAVVAFDATGSEAMGDGGSIVSYQWAQLSGPAVSLSDATSPTPSFTAPDVDLGGADVVFQLTVTDANSQTGTDTIDVHVANPADPVSRFVVTSDAGDPAGGGVGDDQNPQISTFAARNPGDNELDFTVTASTTHGWNMTFAAAMQVPLQVGSYDQVRRASAQAPVQSGMLVQSISRLNACSTVAGHFDILDIQRDDGGNVISLAVDFDEFCDGSTAGLHGKLRYNSSVPMDAPFADVGLNQQVDEGTTVTLGNGDSQPGVDGDTLSYQWTQLSGISVTLSDATSAAPTFTSPNVPLGGADLVFQLEITNSDGATSTRSVTVHIANPADAKSIIYAEKDPNGFIGTVQTQTIRAADALFAAGGSNQNVLGAAPNHVAVQANEDALDDFSVNFLSPSNQTLQAGQTYGPLGQFTDIASSSAQLGASVGLVVPCGSAVPVGSFIVRDIQRDDSGKVTSFAADFDEKCDVGLPGLYGWVRYNSAVPLDTPFAVAGPPQTAYPNMTVLLDGSHSHIGLGGTLTYSWSQVVAKGDPVVKLTVLPGGKASFLVPSVTGTGRTLQFQLTAGNGHGLNSTDTVAINVGSDSAVKNAFLFQSAPGDPAGQGTSGILTSADHDMSQAGFMQPIFPATSTWFVEFAESSLTPVTGPATGTFFVVPGTDFPFLLAASGDEDCEGGIAGTFVVRDIAVTNNQVTRLAVDFLQHCNGSPAPLLGAYRFNSTAPMVVNTPAANPGPAQNLAGPGLVTLDGSNSFPGWSGPLQFSWKQVGGPAVTLSKPTNAVTQFAVPVNLVTVAGNTFKFALTVSNSSGQSVATTVVTAALPSTTTLSLQSDVGDPIGAGQTLSLTTLSETQPDAASVQMTGSGWFAEFRAPAGQQLAKGTYNGVTLYSRIAGPSAKMFVNMAKLHAPTCNTVSGDFTVQDVQYGGPHGVISSLAIDFDQTCNGAPGALHGQLRFHSAVP